MYEAFYNLSAKPFQLSPDPRFFFNSKGHKRALAYLRYGIKQGEGFIIVTGNVGTGKTTLVSALFQGLAKENIVATQIVTTQMRADDLLRMVAAGFGLAYEHVGKAALLRHLEAFFRSCVEEGKRVLLVVDEAQGLPRNSIEELRMLSNFQMGGKSLLQSFLLGQREFRNTMRSPGFEQLRQRVIAAYHLKPLDSEETRAYIEHRLRTVGWDDDPHITEEAFAEIYRFTEGVPRRINTLCDRLMLFAYLEELHTINHDALAAVTEDIIEEHGGTEIEPTSIAGGYAQGGLDALGHQGNGTDPALAGLSPTANVNSEARLSAVEHSVASLANVLRDELTQLREALVEQTKNDSGENK